MRKQMLSFSKIRHTKPAMPPKEGKGEKAME
jgi:hypothetical protein